MVREITCGGPSEVRARERCYRSGLSLEASSLGFRRLYHTGMLRSVHATTSL